MANLNVFRIADDVKPTRDMVALQTALASQDPAVQVALRQLLVLTNLAHGQQISEQHARAVKDYERNLPVKNDVWDLNTDRWSWGWQGRGR